MYHLFLGAHEHPLSTAIEPVMAQVGPSGGLQPFLPLILILAVFYFLLIRPQMKRQKEHKSLVDSLKRNDSIVTTGGMYGRIVEVTESTVVIEVASNVKVKFDKSQIDKRQSGEKGE
tara:strand:+ start:209 stop:559 length:351 start_codon:yes stop_codon:yes gene_type:complete